MNKAAKNALFYGGTLVVVGTLTFLSLQGNRDKRYVPRDENHPRPVVWTACRDCHAPGRMAPQPAKHPPKENCKLCHRDQKV